MNKKLSFLIISGLLLVQSTNAHFFDINITQSLATVAQYIKKFFLRPFTFRQHASEIYNIRFITPQGKKSTKTITAKNNQEACKKTIEIIEQINTIGNYKPGTDIYLSNNRNVVHRFKIVNGHIYSEYQIRYLNKQGKAVYKTFVAVTARNAAEQLQNELYQTKDYKHGKKAYITDYAGIVWTYILQQN